MVEPKHSGPASYLRSQYVSEETGVGITITEDFKPYPTQGWRGQTNSNNGEWHLFVPLDETKHSDYFIRLTEQRNV